jgi:6-pyruvoyltetrahydropterin/6-carboxytetrahydropterin synthase
MHKLCRYVRFSINPFLPADETGFNSFASKPAGEGLSVFLELGVELAGEADTATGLIVNVSDIDQKVRECAVGVFAEKMKADYRAARHIGYDELTGLLKIVWEKLADKFGSTQLSKLILKLSPFKTLAVDNKDCAMVYYSEKFEFAAAHKLWNEKFSEKQNIEVFGRCANPAGHGHNYIVEVTVKYPACGELARPEHVEGVESAGQSFKTGEFEKVIDQELIKAVDHKNLNEDLQEFQKTTPTVENIAVFAWNKLVSQFKSPIVLHCITVWETDKTYSSYYG